MKPSEELREQLDAVLFGNWVNHSPSEPDEACLIARVNISGLPAISLSVTAHQYIISVLPQEWLREKIAAEFESWKYVNLARNPYTPLSHERITETIKWLTMDTPWQWNDRVASSREQVVDVLQKAIKAAEADEFTATI